jgi:uncharacterized protein YdaU (DUF1376 family)
MAALPYMPLYVADYMADAAHLSTVEHGAYLLLIMTYWQRGSALPADDRKLARIVRMTDDEWRDVRDTLAEFFRVTDDTWSHKRIDQELQRVARKSEQARNARASRETPSTDAAETPVKPANNGRATDVDRTRNDTDTDTDTREVTASNDAGADSAMAEAIVAWNALASECGLPAVQRVSAERRKALRKCLGDVGGIEGWHGLLANIRGSPFLRGETGRNGWCATFDFVVKPKNYTRIAEGWNDAKPRGSAPKRGQLTDVERRDLIAGGYAQSVARERAAAGWDDGGSVL